MANILIKDLLHSKALDQQSKLTIRGGRFGVLFATPYELIGASSGGGTTNFNFFVDEFVSNTINQTTVQNINVGNTIGSTVNIIAPQTVGAEQEGVITASVGDLLAEVPA